MILCVAQGSVLAQCGQNLINCSLQRPNAQMSNFCKIVRVLDATAPPICVGLPVICSIAMNLRFPLSSAWRLLMFRYAQRFRMRAFCMCPASSRAHVTQLPKTRAQLRRTAHDRMHVFRRCVGSRVGWISLPHKAYFTCCGWAPGIKMTPKTSAAALCVPWHAETP